ncbi:polysaccharide pyruvyl transferase family protein [Sphingobacterium sp. BS-2]|uniref:polysaccharide pyruvyl transferase family protein n=1 Tax=Sphingobacterium sp. BS-2 TaxID=3377129 RepID=UPI0038FCB1B7
MKKNNKSVGILTMPVKENYGGVIQAAALYNFLETNGYKPCLILKKYDETLIKRIMRNFLSNNPFYFIFDYKNLTRREKQSKLLIRFIDKFFKNKTKIIYDKTTFLNEVSKLETIVVGSDQVWRFNYIGSNYKYYFLAYVPHSIKKISYAASFGVEEWEGPSSTIEDIKSLLKNFNRVSVREKSGVNICKEVFQFNDAKHVLDPTFLPSIEFYESIINEEIIHKKVNLFSYVLDNSHYVSNTISLISKLLNLEVSEIKLTEYKNKLNPSLSEWLYHYKNAQFIVTDSFHGMVFSILFNKQFVCIGNKSRGFARFESLLEDFNLKDRLIFDYDQNIIQDLVNNPIDYQKVNSIKSALIKTSKEFLLNGLIEE